MNISRRSTGFAIAAVAASLFSLAPLASHADSGSSKLGACFGVNACKGKSSCKSAHNACKGQNSCKGKGFVEGVSSDTCSQLGGNFKSSDEAQEAQAQN